jgi:hypothetical protein
MRIGVSRLIEALVIVGLLAGAGLIVATLLRPGFTENYARSLLVRHDPTLATETWDTLAVGDESGRAFEESSAAGLFKDPELGTGFREASVAMEEGGGVVRAELNVVGSRTLEIGKPTRRFVCPDDTEINVSTQETADYFYLGIAGNGLTRLWIDIFFEETGAFKIPATNATAAAFDELILSKTRENAALIAISRIWYFAPNEREEYEGLLADIPTAAKGCTEVAV